MNYTLLLKKESNKTQVEKIVKMIMPDLLKYLKRKYWSLIAENHLKQQISLERRESINTSEDKNQIICDSLQKITIQQITDTLKHLPMELFSSLVHLYTLLIFVQHTLLTQQEQHYQQFVLSQFYYLIT